MSLLTLFTNKYFWIILTVGGIVTGLWFKIHGLEKDVEKAQKALSLQIEANKTLENNNATLHQNLDLALSINDANAKILSEIKQDQDLAATTLTRLSADLSASKITLNEARIRLASTTLPAIPVPQRIVEAILTIQDTRTTQAVLNKKLEDELK